MSITEGPWEASAWTTGGGRYNAGAVIGKLHLYITSHNPNYADDIRAIESLPDLLAACESAMETINRLQTRLSDAGLLGTADDLNGFYNGTGVDGKNVQACQQILAAIAKAQGHDRR